MAVLPLAAQTSAAPAAKNAPQEKTVTKNAVPSVQALDAQAWMLRQQVGASLYDRSFTLREGERALKRMEAVEAYANEIFSKDGGPTARDLRRLANKLNNAEKMLDRWRQTIAVLISTASRPLTAVTSMLSRPIWRIAFAMALPMGR